MNFTEHTDLILEALAYGDQFGFKYDKTINNPKKVEFFKYFKAAKHKLFHLNPFLYNILHTDIQVDLSNRVQIAGIRGGFGGKYNLHLNPDNIVKLKLSVDGFAAVLAHEVLHILWYKNIETCPRDQFTGEREYDVWNVACDMVINRELYRVGFKINELMTSYISVFEPNNIYIFRHLEIKDPRTENGSEISTPIEKMVKIDANKKTAEQLYTELIRNRIKKGDYIVKDGKPIQMRTFKI